MLFMVLAFKTEQAEARTFAVILIFVYFFNSL